MYRDKRMEKNWEKISSKKVFETKWFYINEDRLVTPAGKKVAFYILHKPVGAVVIPADSFKIHLVRQFRPAVWKYSWEFPMGTAGDRPAGEVAEIELREETGFRARQWTHIGSLVGAPGTSAQKGEVYLAEGLIAGEPAREIGEEDMELQSFTEAEIDAMISRGEIFDGWTITSWYFYKQYLAHKK